MIAWAAALHISASQHGILTEAQLSDFHARFAPLPIVTLSKAVAGYPVVIVENYQGMCAVVAHLIKVHGCRRIALIRGPEGHPSADARYQTYRDTLATYTLPLNPDLITPPLAFNDVNGALAVTLLLDERGLRPRVDIDALVAVSDVFALSAMSALQSRGIRAPEEIAIAGFNNSAAARFATPAITSVVNPFDEQGRRSVNILKQLLAGAETPQKIQVPSQLAVHQSCGCLDEVIVRAGMGEPAADANDLPETIPMALRPGILQEMRQALADVTLPDPEWAERLLDAFLSALAGGRTNEFLTVLRETLRQVTSSERTLLLWQNVLSVIQRHTVGCRNGGLALRLLGQARAMLAEVSDRAHADLQSQTEIYTQRLHSVGATLITTFDLRGLMDVLAAELPKLGIPSCYLALYEDPQSYCYPQPAPEWSRLILAYAENGRIPLDSAGQRFATRDLLPAGLRSAATP